MKQVTVLLDTRDCYIELSHHDSDHGSWIVRLREKILWWKRQISSDWFIDRQQAVAFADEMKREHDTFRCHART